LSEGQRVGLRSAVEDGTSRARPGLRVVPYDLPDGCVGAYYPEANNLMPLELRDELAHTPAYKSAPGAGGPIPALILPRRCRRDPDKCRCQEVSVRKATPACGFVEPVTAAEGDEGDMDKSRFEIWPEHHCDHSPAASMPDEPSRERPIEPNA
jgi:hypothetical protein